MGKLFVFFGLNILIYLLFSFIALDMNPLNWAICQGPMGRIIIIILEVLIGMLALEFDE